MWLKLAPASALVLLPLVACSTLNGSDSERTDARLTEAADTATATPEPESVHWTRDSAEYQAVTRQTFALAATAVSAAAKARGESDHAWGVVVDADETVLDNSLFEKECWEQNVGYSPERWSAWVQRKEAKAVPGAAAFTRKVRALGGKVVVVTNRSAADCAATEENLTSERIAYDLTLCMTTTTDKNPRFQAVLNGTAAPGFAALDVITFVGDSINDFPALSQSVLTGSDEDFADFGSRFIVMPNAMYGSWQGNPIR